MPARLLTLLGALAAGCGPLTTEMVPEPSGPDATYTRIGNEEEYTARRAVYDTMPVGDPRRPPMRRALTEFGVAEARQKLAHDRPDAAFEALRSRVLSLWDPDELAKAPADPALAAVAGELERALARRGAHAEALTAVAVQITLAPSEAARARFAQIVAWLRGTPPPGEPPGSCEDATCARAVSDLEAVASAWPSPFVIDQLARLYGQRVDLQAKLRGHGALQELMRQDQLGRSTSFDLARIYLRVGRADAALAAIKEHGSFPGDNAQLREDLEKVVSPTAQPMDSVRLASYFIRSHDDLPVAMRVCQDAQRRFPRALEPALCVGELASRNEQTLLAIHAFDAARAVAPDKHEVWDSLAVLRQRQLAQLVQEDKPDELLALLKEVEAFHAEAAKRFPKQPLQIGLDAAFTEAARGLYNAGRVDAAIAELQRSLAVSPSIPAVDQLATIELKRGHGREALALYARAEGMTKAGERAQDLYWRAKLRRGSAEAFELSGDLHAAKAARAEAVDAYERLLGGGNLDDSERADAELELGKTLYDLGEHARAIDKLENAIDHGKDRESVYADVIAFLVTRGELDEALDAYHRALGRAEVSEYIKVYSTLWILDLGRRAGRGDDPLGRAFLDGVDGDKWHHELGRWWTGRESDAALESHADNPSHRAEAWFYQGLRAAEQGRTDEARALWRKVLQTEMMAFFEYDMAAWYLRHGAAVTPATARGPDGSSI